MAPVRVKICGVTNAADAALAAALGADAVGLNFYAQSPRHVDSDAVTSIVQELTPFVEAVGVFVNLSWAEVCTAAMRFRLRTVQCHGDRHEPGCAFPLRRIDAFPVRDADSLGAICTYLALAKDLGQMPQAVLVDAHVPGQYGGTGRKAPWDLLADFKPGVPLILAGGLTPENIAEAVRLVRPYAVDVASGVEAAPGRKDAEKMRRFIGNACEAAAQYD